MELVHGHAELQQGEGGQERSQRAREPIYHHHRRDGHAQNSAPTTETTQAGR
jgi:hypothetical protein